MKRNLNFAKLQAGYLFPEINRRKNLLLEKEPNAKIISLGIGNTTEPLTPYISKSLSEASLNMATRAGYSGYGDEQGFKDLQKAVADKLYNNIIDSDDIFISDGSKCDIGRIQFLFHDKASIAVQDPAYPAYVDSSVIAGHTGDYNTTEELFDNVSYLACTKDNNYFPDLNLAKGKDVIYFCSPNNPTGAVSSKEELEQLVAFARENNSIIIFDSAYAMFIKDSNLPKSIFEIEGAKECAIEVGSFSKIAGFTGVRLGWTIVPKELKFECGHEVKKDFNRLMCTIFNGASNIIQYGGIAALSEAGLKEVQGLIDFYMENAKILGQMLKDSNVDYIGGENSPYLWAHFPGKKSWDVFEDILAKTHVVTTPGSGFGPAGEGYVRFSAFGSRENVLEACKRLKEVL
jgi:LL-diaminopimelate aminotransferase